MKKLSIFLIANVIAINIAFSQGGAAINSTGASADPSAMLDVTSSTQGVLIPRVDLTSTTIAAPVTNPVASLLVYNKNTVNDVTPGYYYWDGAKWKPLGSNSSPCNVPAQPGTITGGTTVVPNAQNVQYSIMAYLGVFAYQWYVPVGATITSGQGTDHITVNFGNTSGTVSVTGNNQCGASAASTLAVTVSQPKIVFVSSATMESNKTPVQRDALCQSDAASAGLSGTFKAWISNGSSNNVPSTSGYLYQRPDAVMIATNWSDLVDGTLLAPINKTASGAVMNDNVFTGLDANGSVNANTCNDWTSTSNSVNGVYGISSATNSSWSNNGSVQCAGAATPTFLGYVGDPAYYPAAIMCVNCLGGTYINGKDFGNFNNVPYKANCELIPTWNSVWCAKCYKDIVTQTQYRHYCVQQ